MGGLPYPELSDFHPKGAATQAYELYNEERGGGNRAEIVRVIHDGREEIDGLDERDIVGEAVDGGIVTRRDSDQQIGVANGRQIAQDLRELGGAEFGRSTGAVGQAGEPHLFRC